MADSLVSRFGCYTIIWDVTADHNILWFGEELAGEERSEPSIS